MQKSGYILFVFCLSVFYCNAQVRCGTAELHQQMLKTDAAYKAHYDSVNQLMSQWSRSGAGSRTADVIITIPVVVHVLYNTAAQNIPDAQIHSQIDVLNRDFTATNADIAGVPSGFKSRIGNPQINFCLATVTPTGDYTTGIERRYTSVTQFNGSDYPVKFYAQGGLEAWDRNKYLNLWVCYMGSGPGALLGITQPPGGAAQTDGCIINCTVFGDIGNLATHYDRGRTGTHEIGHWLGLYHIWGDDAGWCYGTDYIDDTPNQAAEDYGCPQYPKIDSCSNYPPPNAGDPVRGIMFMNYMDYTDDACMFMFSAGQAAVMNNILVSQRSSLFGSNGCKAPSGLANINAETFVDIYPNPANDVIHLNVRLPFITIAGVTAFDIVGKSILFSDIHKRGEQLIDLDVTSISAGVYTLILNTDQGNIAKRFVIAK